MRSLESAGCTPLKVRLLCHAAGLSGGRGLHRSLMALWRTRWFSGGMTDGRHGSGEEREVWAGDERRCEGGEERWPELLRTLDHTGVTVSPLREATNHLWLVAERQVKLQRAQSTEQLPPWCQKSWDTVKLFLSFHVHLLKSCSRVQFWSTCAVL